MSDDMPMNHAQSVIVPAYVWQDPQQREALALHMAHTMLKIVDRDGYDVVGDVGDASVEPTFLQARVGEANGVRFVAYEQCEAGVADLVFVIVSQPIVKRAAS